MGSGTGEEQDGVGEKEGGEEGDEAGGLGEPEGEEVAGVGGMGRAGRKAVLLHETDKSDKISTAHFRTIETCTVLPWFEEGSFEESSFDAQSVEGSSLAGSSWEGSRLEGGGAEGGRGVGRQERRRFVRVVIQGESFMLHQIRKMVGTALAVLHGAIPSSMLLPSLARHSRIVLPLAPPQGLLVADCSFMPFRAPKLPGNKSPAAQVSTAQGESAAGNAAVGGRRSFLWTGGCVRRSKEWWRGLQSGGGVYRVEASQEGGGAGVELCSGEENFEAPQENLLAYQWVCEEERAIVEGYSKWK
ncbi:unnamed protein product [Closterium sp. Yama58-4]|nr:unnamed protein product [Closterium sp. Yama58-4]